MRNDLISVIVPVYNVEKYLRRCLESLLNQTYKNLEIILINDGSEDKSGNICDEFSECYDNIKVIHKENGGLSSARNAGLEICKGKYVSFVDSDDWLELTFYEELVDTMNSQKVSIVCAGRYDVFETVNNRKIGLCPSKLEKVASEKMLEKILTWNNCDSSVCDKIFDVNLWRNIRFPIGKRSEDVAVMYRIVDKADEIVLYPKPLYNYFHRSGSITTSEFSDNTKDIIDNAYMICDYINKYYPSVCEAAEYFKIKTILYWMQTYTQSGKKKQEYQKKMYSIYHALMLKNIGYYLLRLRYMTIKEKILYIYLLLKI